MKQIKAKVLRNERITSDIYKMAIESPYLARNSKPGQFFEVRCSDGCDPLLRRPLGLHRKIRTGIEFLYELVGKGTELLSRKKAGQLLDIIGPLGNGFDILRRTKDEGRLPAEALAKAGRTIVIAGGIGVAPLVALADELVRSRELGVRSRKRICVIIGAKTASHILCEKEFKALGCDVKIATEDGSKGHKGLATDLLKSMFRRTKDEGRLPAEALAKAGRTTGEGRLTIYACGPVGMLKEVARISRTHRIPCQVSLEERMACGVGVCLGCPVKINPVPGPRSPVPDYKMVCKDGPVFNAEEIAW